MKLFSAIAAGALAVAGLALAQAPEAQTSGAAGASAAAMPAMNIPPAVPAPGSERLGRVAFASSCAPAAAQLVNLGVAHLHSFDYGEADLAFGAAQKADPGCAIAHWGAAMAVYQEIWEPPSAKDIVRGRTEIATARELAAAATPRERAYVEALGAYFDPPEGSPHTRALAYAAKMAELRAAYPEDVDAGAFYGLSLLASEAPGDVSLVQERQAVAVLLPLFKAHPDHPGLAHYLIHACDNPAMAKTALPAARIYGSLAASSAHAVHMPGHIYARLGMWREDIAANAASVAASQRQEALHLPGAAHQMHADEFLVYAYLQTGQREKAKALVDAMPAIFARMTSMPEMTDMAGAGPFFINELRVIYGLETRDWRSLASFEPAAGPPSSTCDVYWGRGVAAGHLHDAPLAEGAVHGFEACLKARTAERGGDQSATPDVMLQEIRAWRAEVAGDEAAARALMTAAADQQDKFGQNEVDIPAREMLGDLLMMQGRPKDALAAYRTALIFSPGRLNGLRSAGDAADAAGMPKDASAFRRAAARLEGDEEVRKSMAGA